jgi:hypothetical protein
MIEVFPFRDRFGSFCARAIGNGYGCFVIGRDSSAEAMTQAERDLRNGEISPRWRADRMHPDSTTARERGGFYRCW